MIGIAFDIKTDTSGLQRISRASKKATYGTLKGAAQLLARTMRGSIRKTKKRPSAPGSPPHTRGGRHSLKSAIRYDVDYSKGIAVIGPDYYVVGKTGYFHEFGGTQIKGKRRTYKVGKVGPVALRPGYQTPLKSLRARIPGGDNIVFTRLKTERQAAWAQRLDKVLWPDIEQKKRVYPKRPFAAPALAAKADKLAPLYKAELHSNL
jgi:hypothetical protein